MERDEYGHYVNDEGVEINVQNDKNDIDHINIYDSCPADNPEHDSIHINWDSETGSGTIVETDGGEKETTDVRCYLTSACMKHMMDKFDDNCEELTILRWFRYNFVSEEDIKHYYETAPIIVESIDKLEDNNKIYEYIYKNVVDECVKAIKNKDYKFAYSRYKSSILVLEEKYARRSLEERLVNALKLKLAEN